jgi:AcrR family transcriptional regulator
MTTPNRPRSTRDRPAKAPLSEDAVVDAALAILRADGLEAVSMRRVAAALDTGAGSLYVYVPNRDGLLAAMRDRVLATVTLERPRPSRWRNQLHTVLTRMRQALLDHPGIAATALADPPTSEAALLVLENLLGILLAGGLDPQDAAWAADVLAALTAHAALEDGARGDGGQTVAAAARARFAQLPAERFPLISAHARELTAGTGDVRFHFAIDVVVDGVLARADRD